ncbi:hypothetical protein [Escherichia coli]
MIEAIFDSESGTTIHKASLKSGAFSGYGKFLAVATCYLRAVFLAIFTDVRYLLDTSTPSDVPFPYLTATVFLRSSTAPFSRIIHNEVENTGETKELSFRLNTLV